MINLLFISDSPKIESIKKRVQPLLKVIIDVVPDFDRGLKNVFEKRPSTVCIQDKISGVTGESVARHIQMILGSDAPTFILIQDGDCKARQITGLFDHVVDSSQSEVSLADEILSILKILIGDQWDKVFIPRKDKTASVSSAAALPFEPLNLAGNLEKNSVTEFETAEPTFDDKLQITQPGPDVEHTAKPDEAPEILQKKSVRTHKPEIFDEQILAETVGFNYKKDASTRSPVVPKPTVTPPDFFISRPNPAAGAEIPNNTMLSFEESYSAKPNTTTRKLLSVLVLLIIVAACGWFFLKLNPGMLPSSITQMIPAARPAQPTPVHPPLQPVPPPAANQNNPLQPVVEKAAPPPALPTFIPRDGQDRLFSEKSPGWERYIGDQVEFRVYRVNGNCKVIQTIATDENIIPDSLVKSVLTEFAGSADYLTDSREKKSGFLLVRGTVAQKADVLFYRKGTTVRAFVVSLR